MTIRTRQQCFDIISEVLTDLLEEIGEEPGTIELTTMLNADLGMTSIDAIHMMVMLEDYVEQPLSFQKLAIRDDEYVEDLAVSELLKFVGDSLDLPPMEIHSAANAQGQ